MQHWLAASLAAGQPLPQTAPAEGKTPTGQVRLQEVMTRQGHSELYVLPQQLERRCVCHTSRCQLVLACVRLVISGKLWCSMSIRRTTSNPMV
jgi:hypothetical protein